jgi:hypothetical protein
MHAYIFALFCFLIFRDFVPPILTCFHAIPKNFWMSVDFLLRCQVLVCLWFFASLSLSVLASETGCTHLPGQVLGEEQGFSSEKDLCD